MRHLLPLLLLPLALAACNPNALVANAAGQALGTGGGALAVKFSATAGTNATTSDLAGSAVFSGTTTTGTPPSTTLIATTVDVVGGGKTRVLTVTLAGAKPTSGAAFPTLGTAAVAGASMASAVTYTEPALKADDKAKIWVSTGGSVSVDTVSGASVALTLKGCTMSATPAGASAPQSDNAGTGTFTLDGTLRVDSVQGL